MQLLHVPGFVNRVVYNGCKAYVDQLKAGEPYTKLNDVIALSICDFVLWPDAPQDEAGQPRVPMLSRWNMTERSSGNRGLLQVQYAFLELPKLPPERPATGAGYWAWLFVHAPELKEVPADLPPGPHREALALANEASFTAGELEAYRRVMDEIQQAREYGDEREARGRAEGEARGRAEGEARGRAEGEARGKVEGLREGEAKGLRAAVVDLCEVLGLSLSDAQQARIATMSVDELEALRQQLKRERRWPD
jgi:hypothetical protein